MKLTLKLFFLAATLSLGLAIVGPATGENAPEILLSRGGNGEGNESQRREEAGAARGGRVT